MMRDVLLAVRADEATHRQYVDKLSIIVFFSNNSVFLESIIN
jgi:hypothetical protein